MKKLVAATPLLILTAAWFAPSCDTGDQTGSGTGGKGMGGEQGQGGATGTGGATAGEGGATGTGGMTQGTGGATGVAGMRGQAGATGTGGMVQGTGGAVTGTGGGGNLTDIVGRPLNGQMLLGPCGANTQAAVCTTSNNCPAANTADRALSGVHTTDKMITLGGDPNTMYTISLHIQGEVEHKSYSNCTDQNATLTSPRADGFCKGSATSVPNQGDAYNVYLIRVINPGQTAAQRIDYFLNSLAPGVSNHTTYGMDYMATINAMGGASIRLLAADSNCSMIKNCGPTVNDGNTCAAPIILQGIDTTGSALNPTFNFTTAYNGQWVLITVKNVTSP